MAGSMPTALTASGSIRPSRRLGILISGRGSNMQAIVEAVASGALEATVALVLSNRADAAGLAYARETGIATQVLDHRGWPSRAAYDVAVADALEAHRVDLVCLAGFMRLLGPAL